MLVTSAVAFIKPNNGIIKDQILLLISIKLIMCDLEIGNKQIVISNY